MCKPLPARTRASVITWSTSSHSNRHKPPLILDSDPPHLNFFKVSSPTNMYLFMYTGNTSNVFKFPFFDPLQQGPIWVCSLPQFPLTTSGRALGFPRPLVSSKLTSSSKLSGTRILTLGWPCVSPSLCINTKKIRSRNRPFGPLSLLHHSDDQG